MPKRKFQKIGPSDPRLFQVTLKESVKTKNRNNYDEKSALDALARIILTGQKSIIANEDDVLERLKSKSIEDTL